MESQLGFPNLLLVETILGFSKKDFRGVGNRKVDDIVRAKSLVSEMYNPFPRRLKLLNDCTQEKCMA